MADLESDLARLENSIGGLEETLAGTEAMTGAFRAEMEDTAQTMRAAGEGASALGRSLGSNLKRAMGDLILDGAKLSNVLRDVGRSLAGSVLTSAMKPVQGAIAGGIGGLFGGAFADGAAFGAGRVRAFANGGIVTGPTRFPMRGGTGLMGEAGPEAIMPLTRGTDGKLGVRAQGGGRAVQVTMNITPPDAESFRRSRTQIAAQVGRALGQGRRNT